MNGILDLALKEIHNDGLWAHEEGRVNFHRISRDLSNVVGLNKITWFSLGTRLKAFPITDLIYLYFICSESVVLVMGFLYLLQVYKHVGKGLDVGECERSWIGDGDWRKD